MEIESLKVEKFMEDVFDLIYPVGSYYETSDPDFDPNVEWGGTWIKDSKGLVTIGAYANGESGDNSYVNTYIKQGEIIGENEHLLTINEIPSHNHRVNEGSDGPGKYPNWGNESGWGVAAQNMNGNGGQSNTAYTGNGESHNIIQPSIGVYRWHRITPSFTLEYTDRNSTSHSESFSPDYEKSDCGLKDYISSVLDSIELTFPEKISLLKVSSFGIDLKSCNNIFSGTDNSSRNINNVIKIDVSDLNTRNTTDMSYMFSTVLYGSPNLEEIILTNLNTKNVKNMQGMFQNKNGLTTLDLSNFNTSSVTDMSSMFYYCATLNSVNLSNFNTDNVTDMSNMFYRCDNLTSLDLSKFNTSNVTDMRYMFFNCSSLTSLDLSSFDTSKASNLSYMFYGFKGSKLDLSNFILKQGVDISGMFSTCENLQELDLSNFDFTKVGKIDKFVFADVPTNCLIYVKDQVAKNFVLSIRSDLTNIQIKS